MGGKALTDFIGFVSVLSEEVPLDIQTGALQSVFRNEAHSAMGKVIYPFEGKNGGAGGACVYAYNLKAVAKYAGESMVGISMTDGSKVTAACGKSKTVMHHIADYGACRMPSFKADTRFMVEVPHIVSLLKLYKECGYAEVEIVATVGDVQVHGSSGQNISKTYIEVQSHTGKARAVYDLALISALCDKFSGHIQVEMMDEGPIRLKGTVDTMSVEYVLAPIVVEKKDEKEEVVPDADAKKGK